MFDLNAITEITGTNAQLANLTELTVEHCTALLIAESTLDLAKPIRKLSVNARVAIQQQFNRAIALEIKAADGSVKDSLQSIVLQAVTRVQAAQQADADEDTLSQSVERLERVINLFADLASSVTRNGFYRHDECVRMEPALADANDSNQAMVPDGANHAGVGMAKEFSTKSTYSGWRRVTVESSVMQEAVEAAVTEITSVIKAVLPMASSYLRTFLENSKGEPMPQLGYQVNSDGEYEQFYTVAEVWANIAANRREAYVPMTAEKAMEGFKL